MSEKKQHIEKESNDYTITQFKDGETALLLNKQGQRTEWDRHKYTRGLTYYSVDMAIVTMKSGRRFGIGKGVAIQLPEIDKDTGKFVSNKAVSGKDLHGLRLPELTIGETWDLIGQEDPVRSLVVRHKADTPGSSNYPQFRTDSPFPELSEMLESAADRLNSSVAPVGFTAISGAQTPN